MDLLSGAQARTPLMEKYIPDSEIMFDYDNRIFNINLPTFLHTLSTWVLILF